MGLSIGNGSGTDCDSMDNGAVTRPVYPQWGCSCHKEHITPWVKDIAGFPDFLFYRTPIHHACVFEVKMWWGYSNETFQSIFTPRTSTTGTGGFDWASTGSAAILIKQVLYVPVTLTFLHIV